MLQEYINYELSITPLDLKHFKENKKLILNYNK